MKIAAVVFLFSLAFSTVSYSLCTWTLTRCHDDGSCTHKGTSFCRDLGCHAETKPNGKVIIYRGNDIVNIGSHDISKSLPENCTELSKFY